jgi:hypothetical protein
MRANNGDQGAVRLVRVSAYSKLVEASAAYLLKQQPAAGDGDQGPRRGRIIVAVGGWTWLPKNAELRGKTVKFRPQ